MTNAIYRTASRDLDDLVKKGLFRKVGKTGRGAYCVLADETGHKPAKRVQVSGRAIVRKDMGHSLGTLRTSCKRCYMKLSDPTLLRHKKVIYLALSDFN